MSTPQNQAEDPVRTRADKRNWIWLSALLCAVYLPFLGLRVLRPAGDDKVYVSQALEMFLRHDFFLQTLGGEPNYYKGPLHYLFVIAGLNVFGLNPWAAVWMNFVLLCLATAALVRTARSFLPAEKHNWAYWTGFAWAFSAGIYSHTFASQMELELAAFFTIGMFFLTKPTTIRWQLAFWLTTGTMGWLKSPMHSAFLGISALLFWGYQRKLLALAARPGSWLCAVAGVAWCIAGYLPALVLDKENFWRTYILRETLDKADFGMAWHVPIVGLFGVFVLPWLPLALVAYADGIRRIAAWIRSRRADPAPETAAREGEMGSALPRKAREGIALGLSLMAPSVVFFLLHRYRFQNYHLPTIAGLFLIIGILWAQARAWRRAFELAAALSGLLIAAAAIAFAGFALRIGPFGSWWPSGLLPLFLFLNFLSAAGLVYFGALRPRPFSYGASAAATLLGFGLVSAALGEREVLGLREYIARQSHVAGQGPRLSYFNLTKNIWSEWGYLNLFAGYPIAGVFTEEQLLRALRSGESVLLPGAKALEQTQALLQQADPQAGALEVVPWVRWNSRRRNQNGLQTWAEAWRQGNIAPLEIDFYIVRLPLSQAK